MKFIQKQGPIIQFLIYLCLIFIGGMFFSILLSLIIPVPDDVADWQFSVGYVFSIVLTIALALTVEHNKIFEKKEQAELRQEYLAAVRKNLKAQLNNIDVKEKDGSVVNLGEKYGRKKGN
mgnify:CR=1 FL=1